MIRHISSVNDSSPVGLQIREMPQTTTTTIMTTLNPCLTCSAWSHIDAREDLIPPPPTLICSAWTHIDTRKVFWGHPQAVYDAGILEEPLGRVLTMALETKHPVEGPCKNGNRSVPVSVLHQ
jgi:hypothetical protein